MTPIRSQWLVAVLALAASLAAQPPKGQLIVSCFNPGTWHGRNGQPGGLFIVHPRTPAAPIQVRGLPPQMTGQGILGSPYSVGCSGIAMLPDGDLLVGEITPPPGSMAGVNASLDVHRVRLTSPGPGTWGAQVLQSYSIATVQSFGEISDLELLPNGDVLIAFYTGALQPRVSVLALGSGTVTQVSLSGFPAGSVVNALALSANGQTAFLGEDNPNRRLGNVWRLPLLPPAAPTALTSSNTMGGVLGLDRDNRGQLLVGTNGAGGNTGNPPNLHLVDPQTGAITDLVPGIRGVRNAVLVERNTGVYFTAGVRLQYHPGPTQEISLIHGSSPIRAPWGIVAGLAMRPAVEAFGSQSTCGTGNYAWQATPNPGGLPQIGSSGFSITMQASSPQPVCLFVFSLDGTTMPAPLPACGHLWLNPALLIGNLIVGSTGGGTTFTLPLGVPNSTGLQGLSVFAQTFHLASTAPPVIASSPGLCLTIL